MSARCRPTAILFRIFSSKPPAVTTQSGTLRRFEDLCQRCAHPHWHPDLNVNIFHNPALSVHAAEQFRTLRSRLYQLRGSQQLRTLLIASSMPAEGKTFVTNNLAQAIVRQPDRRCLIIDADLRCSRLHVPLGAPPSPGLTEYLMGEADEMAVIQHGAEGNLCFIPGGKEVSNPSELLLNGRLKTLLERVTPVFDWVISGFTSSASGGGCKLTRGSRGRSDFGCSCRVHADVDC